MATSHADVDPADGKVHVRFVLAPELEAAGHVPSQQPYFFAEIPSLMISKIAPVMANIDSDITYTALTMGANWATNPNNTSIYAVNLPVTSVVNGNYGVTGMTVSRLLGPKRETLIGSGAVLTDLEIAKTTT